MTEVVQKEILKWLGARVIWPIVDSERVTPIYVVSKKVGTRKVSWYPLASRVV